MSISDHTFSALNRIFNLGGSGSQVKSFHSVSHCRLSGLLIFYEESDRQLTIVFQLGLTRYLLLVLGVIYDFANTALTPGDNNRILSIF